MEAIVNPENPEAEQDLQKMKKLRSNVVVMEQEQRKLQTAWDGNSKERNKRHNMEEQIEMARICVVNARNTFAEYQKFLKEVKYEVWNREKAKKDSLVTPPKCGQGVTEKKSSLVKKPLKRGIQPRNKSKKVVKTISIVNIPVRQAPMLKSNVDEVNTILSTSQQHRNTAFQRLTGTYIKSGDRRRNRRRDSRHTIIKKQSAKLASDLKRAKKQHLHDTAGLQKLPHLVCQFSNYSQFKPNLSCPVGKIYKSSQEMLAHVFFVHRGEIFNQTTKIKKILLACSYNDQLADVKCGDSFHAFSSYDFNDNFESQLSGCLLKLDAHISAVHLSSHSCDQCSVCGQEVLQAEPRHYWQHMATHLQEYKQLLPPGVIPGTPLISSISYQLPCNMGCALSFNSSYDFIAHIIQDHWQEMMTFVSTSQSIRWTCPARGSCGFNINIPVLSGALVEVGKALTLLCSHLIQYHCPDQPAASCPRCQHSLQHMPDHVAWQHIANHVSIDLVWCAHCRLFCRRGELAQHRTQWCRAGEREKEEWSKLEKEMIEEEVENIKDRKESVKKINKVLKETTNEWMQEDFEERAVTLNEKRETSDYLDSMVSNKIIKQTDIGDMITLMKQTPAQQVKYLKKHLPGKKKRRLEGALANLKKEGWCSKESLDMIRKDLIESERAKRKKEKPRKMKKKEMNNAESYVEQDSVEIQISDKSNEMCGYILWEIIETVCQERDIEDCDVSEDEVEFVQVMKRQSAWDLLTPTPKLAKPRPPARYDGMGSFIEQFKQVISETNNSIIYDNYEVDTTDNKSSLEETKNSELTQVPRPAFIIGPSSDKPLDSSEHLQQEQVHLSLSATSSKPEHYLDSVRHADHSVSPSVDKLVYAHQPEGQAVSKPKYTCNKCGTQFSKQLVLQFHMAVHK